MAIDLLAGLGASNQLVASKYVYSFADQGGAQGDIVLAGDSLPAGIVILGYALRIRVVPSSDGAAILALVAVNVPFYGPYPFAALGNDVVIGGSGMPLESSLQTVPLLAVTDADLSGGAFDLWILYVK